MCDNVCTLSADWELVFIIFCLPVVHWTVCLFRESGLTCKLLTNYPCITVTGQTEHKSVGKDRAGPRVRPDTGSCCRMGTITTTNLPYFSGKALFDLSLNPGDSTCVETDVDLYRLRKNGSNNECEDDLSPNNSVFFSLSSSQSRWRQTAFFSPKPKLFERQRHLTRLEDIFWDNKLPDWFHSCPTCFNFEKKEEI